MDVIAWIAQFGGWAWIVAGVILLALETVVPGGVLLWLGMAGIVTGLAALIQPISWPLQFLLFGILSIVSIVVWLRYVKPRMPASDRPLLNQRTHALIGREAILDEPIVGGSGRAAFGDTAWRIAGPDLPAGTRVRVIGAEGATLKVERVEPV